MHVKASTAEPSLWQRTLAQFTGAQPPAQVDVPLPTEKLRLKSRDDGTESPHCPVVLVACGSFNPPTLAHLRMFDLAQHALAEVRRGLLAGSAQPCGSVLSTFCSLLASISRTDLK